MIHNQNEPFFNLKQSLFLQSKYDEKSNIVLKTILLPFQDVCTEWILMQRFNLFSRAVLITLKMGLGKTLISLKSALMDVPSKNKKHILFITVPGAVNHIQNQINIHFANVRTNYQNFLTITNLNFFDITVLCYTDLLRNDLNLLRHYTFSTCILDEVHAVSARSKVVSVINDSVKANFFLALTGTPSKKYPLNVLSHVASWPKPNDNDDSSAGKAGVADIKEEKTCLTSFFSSQEQELSKCIQRISIDLNTQQHEIYMQHINNWNEKKKQKKKTPIWTFLTEMRKFLSQIKVPFVTQLLKNIEKNAGGCSSYKVAIFSEFATTLFSVQLNLLPNSFVKIISSRDIQKNIAVFNSQDSCRFLLATREIAGTGIDLGFVDVLILIEPSYHAYQTEHLIGRIRRLGQKARNVEVQQVMEFVVKNTCEEDIVSCKQTIRDFPPEVVQLMKQNENNNNKRKTKNISMN